MAKIGTLAFALIAFMVTFAIDERVGKVLAVPYAGLLIFIVVFEEIYGRHERDRRQKER